MTPSACVKLVFRDTSRRRPSFVLKRYSTESGHGLTGERPAEPLGKDDAAVGVESRKG